MREAPQGGGFLIPLLLDFPCYPFADGLKLVGIDTQVVFAGQVFDLAEGGDNAGEEGRMGAEPTGRLDVALLAGHLIEESDEAAWIVACVPAILDAELIGFGFEFAVDAEEC